MAGQRYMWLLLLFAASSCSASVNESAYVDVGEHEVYLEISGPSETAPLLVFLHGGPGSVAHLVTFQSSVGRRLEHDFLIAYMHQRGVGKSSPVPASAQTLSAHVGDLANVVDYLRERYNQDRVHVVGHSWGGMLAGLYAEEHGEDIDKLVLIATATNVSSLLRDSYEVALRWAQEEDVPEAVAELTGLDQSLDTRQDFFTVLSWADRAGGTASGIDLEALWETLNIDIDYPNWREQQNTINFAMAPEIVRINLDDSMSVLDVPALFVSGARDTIITETTMRREYDRYSGDKTFVLLEESHHLPFIDQPDALAREVRAFLQE